MSLLKRASGAYVWSQIGRLAEVGLFFLYSLLLARWLGPKGYGVFSLGLSLILFSGFLAGMGVGQETLGRFVPEAAAGRYRGGLGRLVKHLAGIRILAVLALSAALLLAGQNLGGRLGVADFRNCLGWVLLVFGLRSVCDLMTYVFCGLLELRVVAVGRLVVPLVALIVLFGILRHEGKVGMGAPFAALAIGQATGLLVFLLAAGRGLKSSREPLPGDEVGLRRILTFGLFTWLAGFFIYVLGDGSDVLLLGWLLKDARAVGWYAVGANLVFRSTALILAWVPQLGIATLSRARLQGGLDGLAQAGEAFWKLIAVSLIPFLVLLMRISPALVTLLYSARYSPSVPVVATLAVCLALSGFLGFGLQAGILYVLDREKVSCALFGVAAALNLLLAFPLIHWFGILGAAAATGVAFLSFSLLSALAGAALAPLRWPWAFLLKVSAASLVAAGATFFLRADSWGTVALVASLWLSVLLLCLWVVKPLQRADAYYLEQISPHLGRLTARFAA